MMEWQLIRTALDEGDAPIMLFCEYEFESSGGIFIGYYDDGWCELDSGIEYTPSHWAPLPKSPTTQSDNGVGDA